MLERFECVQVFPITQDGDKRCFNCYGVSRNIQTIPISKQKYVVIFPSVTNSSVEGSLRDLFQQTTHRQQIFRFFVFFFPSKIIAVYFLRGKYDYCTFFSFRRVFFYLVTTGWIF